EETVRGPQRPGRPRRHHQGGQVMSASQLEATQTPATATEAAPASLLDEVIAATKQTERSRAEDLIRTLADEALKGTVTYSKNVTHTIKAGIQALDAALSKQLAAVLHHPTLQKMEGTWRGLHYLVMNTETSAQLKIRVLNVTKRDLARDMEKAVEF